MNPRLGNALYWTGLIGAGVCIFFVIDTIWIFQSGRSLLLVTGRFVTRDGMIVTAIIGVSLALVSWRLGVVARRFFSRPAGRQRARGGRGGDR